MRRAGTLGAGGGSTPLGEGCALFLVDGRDEGSSGGVLADLVGFEFGATEAGAAPATTAAGLAGTVRTLLARTGVAPEDLWLVSLAQSGDGSLDEAELAAVDEVLGSGTRRIVASERTGNSFSALGAFQLAAALAVAGQDPPSADPRRPCLLTSLGIDGSVGCALVRI
jgi:3-oxoacyl-[acyl-carrier-protein] synthase II